MFAGNDPALFERPRLEFSDMIGRAMIHGMAKGEVEIAVEEPPVPSDADLVAAH